MVEVVGVAVGCTIGAVFITVLIVLFIAWCINRVKKRRSQAQYNYLPAQYSDTEFYVEKRSKFNTFKNKIMKNAVRVRPLEKTKLRPQGVQPETQGSVGQARGKSPHWLVKTQEPQPSLGGRPVSRSDMPAGMMDGNSENSPFDISYFSRILDTEKDGDGPDKPSGDNQGCGALKYSLAYDYEQQKLQVKLVLATNLKAKDVTGTSDPYVKASIVPSARKLTLETKTKMKNLNPVWNETFHFEDFPIAKLETKSLILKVLDYDRFSKDDPIGKVIIRLNEVDFTAGNLLYYKYLRSCHGDQTELGDILLSLCYNSTEEVLSLGIKRCRNLKAKDIGGSSDPYVKVWMTDQGKQKEKRKTRILMHTLTPTYNDYFDYAVPPTKIKDIGFRIIVMDYDRFSKNDMIGELVLSTKSGPGEIRHWHDMLERPRQEVEHWHTLKELKK